MHSRMSVRELICHTDPRLMTIHYNKSKTNLIQMQFPVDYSAFYV